MKQSEINKAYNSLLKLSELKLPYKKSRDIYKMLNLLKEHFQFYVREQQKIIAFYKGTIDGQTITFNEGTNDERITTANKCFGELTQLTEGEVEIEIQPVIITETDFDNQSISPVDFDNLNGFIIFE